MSGTIPTTTVRSQRPGNECVLALRCSTRMVYFGPPRGSLFITFGDEHQYQNENRSRLIYRDDERLPRTP